MREAVFSSGFTSKLRGGKVPYRCKDNIYVKWGFIMAKPISYGLILEGEDAKRFDEYMENPQFSDFGISEMRKVILRERKEETVDA